MKQWVFTPSESVHGELPARKRAFVATDDDWETHLATLEAIVARSGGSEEVRADGGRFARPSWLAGCVAEMARTETPPTFRREVDLLHRWLLALPDPLVVWTVDDGAGVETVVPLPVVASTRRLGAPIQGVVRAERAGDVTVLVSDEVQIRVGDDTRLRIQIPRCDTPRVQSVAIDLVTRRVAFVWTDRYREQLAAAMLSEGWEASPAGELVVVGLDGDEVRVPVCSPVPSLGFATRDGRRVVVDPEFDGVRLIDAESGAITAIARGFGPPTRPLSRVKLTPDEQLVVVGDSGVFVCDPETGSQRRLGGEAAVPRLASFEISPSGRHVVGRSHRSFHVWDLAGGDEVRVPDVAALGEGTAFGFFPDAHRFAASSWGGQLQIADLSGSVDIARKLPVKLADHTSSPRRCVVTRDGRHVALVSDFGVALWSADGKKLVALFTGPLPPIRCAVEEESALSICGSDGVFEVFDLP